MKIITLFFLVLILFARVSSAQINPCNLFYEAFNTADQGFPSLRPGTADGQDNYSVDSSILQQYQLASGNIYVKKHQPVPGQEGRFYSLFTLEMQSQWQITDQTWEILQKELESTFINQCRQYHEACFKDQLVMSPVTDKENDVSKLRNIFFYHPSLQLSEGDDFKSMLLGSKYIEFSLQKSLVYHAFRMNYTIESAVMEN